MQGLGKALAALLMHAPDIEALIAEAEAEFNTIAHGHGGAAKVANAAAGAAALAQTASKVASEVA